MCASYSRGTIASKLVTFPVFLMVAAAVPGFSQAITDGNPNQTINIKVADGDKQASTLGMTSGVKQIHKPQAGFGMKPVARELALSATPGVPTAAGSSSSTAVPYPGYFYPGDLTYDSHHGHVITDMMQHPIYVNTTPGTVGYPGTLLNDLGKSNFIHILDQYVGVTGDNRYQVAVGGVLNYPVKAGTALVDNTDIASIVHAGAVAFGQSGYHVEYHVFLAPGQDVCFAGTPLNCYSPDNNSAWGFCAYHGSFVFSDVGEVIYSVIPYQAVNGCQVGLPSPNGLVMDSTMSVLSHELSESITDPDGTAWWNHTSLDLYGSEIADECQNATFYYPSAVINGRWYEMQAEYSNAVHACTYTP